MTNEKMMRSAIELAKQAALIDEVPIGAIVFDGKNIVGRGYNQKEKQLNPTAHAEIIAITDAAKTLGRWRLHGCTLAVTLEPCPMCAGAILNARLDKVVYGAHDYKAGACKTLFNITDDSRLNHQCRGEGGILEKDCLELLQNFFKTKR